MGNCSLCSEPPESGFERPERNQFKEIKDQKIQSDCFASFQTQTKTFLIYPLNQIAL